MLTGRPASRREQGSGIIGGGGGGVAAGASSLWGGRGKVGMAGAVCEAQRLLHM